VCALLQSPPPMYTPKVCHDKALLWTGAFIGGILVGDEADADICSRVANRFTRACPASAM
jgi:hypothetical protein